MHHLILATYSIVQATALLEQDKVLRLHANIAPQLSSIGQDNPTRIGAHHSKIGGRNTSLLTTVSYIHDFTFTPVFLVDIRENMGYNW